MKPLSQLTIDAMNRQENIVLWQQGEYACPVYVEHYWFDGMGTMRATVFNLVTQTPEVVHASELTDAPKSGYWQALQMLVEPGALVAILNPEKQIVWKVAIMDMDGNDIQVAYSDNHTEWIADGLQYVIHIAGHTTIESINARLRKPAIIAQVA